MSNLMTNLMSSFLTVGTVSVQSGLLLKAAVKGIMHLPTMVDVATKAAYTNIFGDVTNVAVSTIGCMFGMTSTNNGPAVTSAMQYKTTAYRISGIFPAIDKFVYPKFTEFTLDTTFKTLDTLKSLVVGDFNEVASNISSAYEQAGSFISNSISNAELSDLGYLALKGVMGAGIVAAAPVLHTFPSLTTAGISMLESVVPFDFGYDLKVFGASVDPSYLDLAMDVVGGFAVGLDVMQLSAVDF